MPKIMKRMNTVSRAQALYRAAHLPGDLCAAHHSFVLAICRMPGCTQEALAKEICLNKSTVTRALAALQERGYVTRESNPADRRQMLVFPTDKMRQAHTAVRDITRSWNEALTEGIDAYEMAIFDAVLSRLEERARELTSREVDA